MIDSTSWSTAQKTALNEGSHALGATPVAPPAVAVDAAAQRIGQTRSVVFGECRAPRLQERKARFDLAGPDGRFVSVELSGDNYVKVSGFLRRSGSSLEALLVEGNLLTVDGELRFDTWSGRLVLVARRLSKSVHTEGWAATARMATANWLRQQFRAGPRRLARQNAQAPHLERNELSSLLIDPFHHVVAITASSSQTAKEFASGLRSAQAKRLFNYREIRVPMVGSQAPAIIARTLADLADTSPAGTLVVIHRGGGDWSGLDVFDSRAVVEAIATSPLRVLTAIGHRDDIHLADRAAFASADTPTRLGTEISNAAWAIAKRRDRTPAKAAPARPSELERLRTELHATQRARDQALAGQRSATNGMAHHHRLRMSEAETHAYRRVVLRARLVAVAASVLATISGIAALNVGVSVLVENRTPDGGKLVGALVGLGMGLALLFFAARAPRRARLPLSLRYQRRHELPERGSEQWFAAAAKVKTVGQFRAVFAGRLS
ncbi:hypothetical protein HQQ80_11535 [Microbacteriaceae bacterium VKM Ac-2855]|nr:hypothetical protein [Microbacteriaceae bacterium VKM Ac-2855]